MARTHTYLQTDKKHFNDTFCGFNCHSETELIALKRTKVAENTLFCEAAVHIWCFSSLGQNSTWNKSWGISAILIEWRGNEMYRKGKKQKLLYWFFAIIVVIVSNSFVFAIFRTNDILLTQNKFFLLKTRLLDRETFPSPLQGLFWVSATENIKWK